MVEGGDFYEKRETILVPGRLRAPVGNRGDEPLPKLSDPNRKAHGGCERPADQTDEGKSKTSPPKIVPVAEHIVRHVEKSQTELQ